MGYDEEDRLISVGSNWSADYRGDGLRGWKQVNGSRVYYLYDGMNAVLEEDGSGKIVAEETFGPEGPLARSSGGRVLLYTPDGQGNVSQQVDAGSGNVVASYLFDGYGVRKVASSDPTASQDPYSGLWGADYLRIGRRVCVYWGFRYYDVLAGRFLTRDPIGFEGGINLYEYVNNNPLMMHDTSGYGSPIYANPSPRPKALGVILCGLALANAIATLFNSYGSDETGQNSVPVGDI